MNQLHTAVFQADFVLNLFDADTAIHVITREELFRSGALVDVSDIAREAGFRAQVAMSPEAWADCVQWDDSDTERQCPQDQEGRLWDVLWMAKHAVTRNRFLHETLFEVHRVPRGGRADTPVPVLLKLTISSGDDGRPAFTISQAAQQ